MFIFRSSSGPHDPVQHHTHTLTHSHTLTQTVRHSFKSTKRGAQQKKKTTSSLCSTHGNQNLHAPTLSLSLSVSLSVSLSKPTVSLWGCFSCPSVQRGSGVEGCVVEEWRGGLRCSSAGPTSQLPHCSPSPPSGKLVALTCPGS